MAQSAAAGTAAGFEHRGIEYPQRAQRLLDDLRRLLGRDDCIVHRKFPQRTGSGLRLFSGQSSPSTGVAPRVNSFTSRLSIPRS
jgi:hypothetical protein